MAALMTSVKPAVPGVTSPTKPVKVTFSASVSSVKSVKSTGRKSAAVAVSCSISVDDDVENWARDVRSRLCDVTDVSDVSELADELRREVNMLLVVVLQQDNHIAWRYLSACMPLLEPHRHHLQSNPEFQHYVNRIVQTVQQNPRRFAGNDVISAVSLAFPAEVTSAQCPSRDFRCPPRKMAEVKLKSPRTPRVYKPDDKDPFRMQLYENLADEPPSLLTFGDIRASLPNVGMEVADRESIWGHSMGKIAQAMDLNLLDDVTEEVTSRLKSRDTSRELSAGELDHRVESAPAEIASPQKKAWCPRQTGREAVQYFTSCYHTGQIKYQYFNVVPNKFYNPYDLISTHKNKADADHYVFSTFGVLHVTPPTSDNLSLVEWQTEAVLWTAVSKIHFFRTYLINKMFNTWRANVRYQGYVKRRETLNRTLVHAVPVFGHALVQLSGLLQELETLTFLPYDMDKTFELSQFEDEVTFRNSKAEAVLDKFYKFVKQIITSTAESSLKRLKHAEEQAQHKIEFSKESIHLQKRKKEQRAANLQKARHEASQLGNFVKLVDQLVLARLVAVARTNTETFVRHVMAEGAPHRDGLLRAKLVFNDKDHLELSPGRERFIRTLGRALSEIPSVLCEAALTIADSLGIGRASSRTRRKTLKSTPSSVGFADQIGGARHDVIRRQGIPDLADGLEPQDSARDDQDDIEETETTDEENSAKEERRGGGNQPPQADTADKLVVVEKRVRLATPEHMEEVSPRKEDDDLGVATPDLVQEAKTDAHLEIEGHGFLGQYSPLHHGNLDDKLAHDESYKSALALHERLLSEALAEVEQYAQENRWLEEICTFCNSWTETSTIEWQGKPSFNIEQQLAKLKSWTERVKSFDNYFVTENGLMYVDCSEVQNRLVPRLQSIFTELAQSVAHQAKMMGLLFIDDMKEIINNLRSKSLEVNRFAQYTKDVAMYKSKTIEYQHRQDYIKSLLEVIRMSYRQLTSEEEAVETKLGACWEDFLFCIQDANQYIATETPAITRMLEDTYQQLEEQLQALYTESLSAQYLTPSHEPQPNITQLRDILHAFYHVRDNLCQMSENKREIMGEPLDLDYVEPMKVSIETRYELWKYIDISANSIAEWKKMLFRKMNVRQVHDKVGVWQLAAFKMKGHLPADDQLLQTYYISLQDFKQDLPLLHKLSNPAMKAKHWRAVFIGMGEPYDPSADFTVEELLAYNLSKHSTLINTIYSSALAEYRLELKLNKISKLWSDRQLKLAKHVPDSVYYDSTSGVPPKGLTRIEKFRAERARSARKKGLDLSSEDLYILTDTEELLYLIQDSSITLQTMLSSRHLAAIRGDAELWTARLTQIHELVTTWITCQDKWLYLLRMFDDYEFYKSFGEKTVLFDDIHQRYKDFIKSVSDDPRVIALVKSERNLSGDVLKQYLQDLIHDQERVEVLLTDKVSAACCDYPRLFFLSREEVMDLLATSRNPNRLLRSVRKCFPGIENINYSLYDTGSVSQLDIMLNADKLCATSLVGTMNEVVPLTTKVKSLPSNTAWLATMENAMKVTMATVLQATIDARLAHGSEVPESAALLSELAKLEAVPSDSAVGEIKREVQLEFQHWLLRFPAQCVLVAEGVLWSRDVQAALTKRSREELEKICNQLNQKIQCYTDALRSNNVGRHGNDTKCRLHILLGNLIGQACYHKDAVKSLLTTDSTISDSDYKWLRLPRYCMPITSMLRAKTEPGSMKPCPSETLVRQETLSPVQTTRSRSFTLERAVPADLPEAKAVAQLSHINQYGDLRLHQLGYTHVYDHEYLGPAQISLVHTPLTDRALLTLLVGLKHFQVGTMTGHCARGKTTTVQYLAQLLGRHLVTLTCSQTLTLRTLLGCMYGTVQAGSWLLLDDAHNLDLGLMSVLSQHLDTLRLAYKSRDTTGSVYDKVKLGKRGERYSVPALHSDDPSPKPVETTEEHRPHSVDRDQNLVKLSPYGKQAVPPPLMEDVIDENHRWAELQPAYRPAYVDDVTFDGVLMTARATYGCFMTMDVESRTYASVPECLKVLLRPCCLLEHDLKIIVEIRLLQAGFINYQILATKFCLMVDLLQTQMPTRPEYNITLRVLHQMLNLADYKLSTPRFQNSPRNFSSVDCFIRSYHEARQEAALGGNSLNDVTKPADDVTRSESGSVMSTVIEDDGDDDADEALAAYTPRPDQFSDDQSREEYAVIYGLVNVMTTRLTSADDMTYFRCLLRDVFPVTARPKSGLASHDPGLVSAIQDEMISAGLQATPQHVTKILQLYSALEHQPGVIVSGVCGSGKTSSYQILARAINSLTTVKTDDDKDDLSAESSCSPSRVKLIGGERVFSPNTVRWKKKTLAVKRINRLYRGLLDNKAGVVYPRVDMTVLNPGCYTNQQLFGHLSADCAHREGLLTHLIRSANQRAESSHHVLAASQSRRLRDIERPMRIENWLIMDGPVSADWLEGVSGLVEERKKMTLDSRGTLGLENSISVLFETTDLISASPALLAKCPSIHLDSSDMHWSALIESWGPQAKQNYLITGASLRLIIELANSVFPETLYYMADCRRSLPPDGVTVAGVAEVTSFLHVLSALLQRHLLREDWEKALVQQRKSAAATPASTRVRSSGSRMSSSLRVEENVLNYMAIIKAMFAYSFVWAFGGQLHESHRDGFDRHARSILSRAVHPIMVPEPGNVFEYSVDAKAGTLVRWEQKQEGKAKASGSQFILLPQLEGYVHLMELLLGYNHPFLLVGAPGSGKTALLQNYIFPKYQYTRLPVSADFHPEKLYNSVNVHISELRQKRGQVLYGNKMVSRHLFFLDDMNMANMDADKGVQPTLELLRHALTSQGMYDYNDLTHRQYREASFIGACTTPDTPGGGYGVSSSVPSARLCRLMVVLTLVTPTELDCHHIYGRIIQGWLDEFPTYSLHHTKDLGKAMTQGLLDVYHTLRLAVPPSVTCQNVLTLHQLAQTVQGLLLFSPRQRPPPRPKQRQSVTKRKKASVHSRESSRSQQESPVMMRPLVRLWCHEVSRTFSDRLYSTEDLNVFKKTLREAVEKHFCSPIDRPEVKMEASDPAPSESEAPGSRPPTSASSVVPKSLSDSPKPSRPESSDVTMSELASPPPVTELESILVPTLPDLQTTAGNEAEQQDKKSSTTVPPGSVSGQTEETTARTAETESSGASESSDSESEDESVSVALRGKKKSPRGSSQSGARTISSLSTDTHVPVYHGAGRSSQTPVTPGRSSKRGVTFKQEKKEEMFVGPLYNMEQICDPGEELTDFVFSRQILTAASEIHGQPSDRGYTETPMMQLEDALTTCLQSYNSHAPQKLDVIVFSDLVRHVARLARILSLPGGSAVLLGEGMCTGRSTVVKLAAFICKCKVFELKSSDANHRDVIKRCCRLAASQRHALLYVRDDVTMECLRDVSSLVQDGTCSDLYSQEEFTEIALSMLPSHVTTRRLDKLEQAFDKYIRRVIQHLHVVVAFDGHDKTKLSRKLVENPALMKRCHGVDFYRMWQQDAYVAIATRLLEAEKSTPLGLHGNVQTVSAAMAFCHVTAREAVRLQYRHVADNFRTSTPSTFLQFEKFFLALCRQVTKQEKANLHKYDKSLNKVREARYRIANFENDLAKLRPRWDDAMQVVQQKVQDVESKKKAYVASLEVVKREEADVEAMMEPLNELKNTAQNQFDKINPMYFAALDAFKVLDNKVIEELKTYREPPEGVVLVVKALCLLFGKPLDWEGGKSLLISENFFQEMEFFDKDAIPDDVFKKLETDFILHPEFTPARTRVFSHCAEAICVWVRAIYNYGCIYREMKPRLAKLLDAEDEAKKAQAALGRKRMESQRVRGELEARIQAHKEAMNNAKTIEKKILAIERNMQRANTLMENMTLQHNLWKDELTTAQNRCHTAIGDSLLTAACISYLGPLSAANRTKLLNLWHRHFDNQTDGTRFGDDVTMDSDDVADDENNIQTESKIEIILKTNSRKKVKTPTTVVSDISNLTTKESSETVLANVLQIREGFCLEDILSDFSEQCKWRLEHNPLDVQAVQNAMFVRMIAQNSQTHWPLLIDPDDSSLAIVRMVLDADWLLSEEEEPADDVTKEGGVVVEEEKDSSPEKRPRALSRVSSKSLLSTSLPLSDIDIPSPDPEITRPDSGIWCLCADDSRLDQYLVNALVHGVSMLITHVERRPMPAHFADLLRKRYTKNNDLSWSVRVGQTLYRVHPRFRMYLSTSVALGEKGVEYCDIPLEDTSPIDLTITGAGLYKLLLAHLMRVERPEFEAAERGLESDIIHQRHEIRNAQEKVLEKSVTVKVPLLEEETMLDALTECKETIEKAETVLADNVDVDKGLEDKRKMYCTVVDNAVTLYTVLKRMTSLSPTYAVPLADFVQTFSRAVQMCQRGKGLGGDTAPRTEELYLSTTAAILEKLRHRMTEQDYILYSLLISLEGLKKYGLLTDLEEEMILAGKPLMDSESESESEDTPEWMSEKMASSVVYLENNLPVFSGLMASMANYDEEWEEYFKHPIVLLSLLPDPAYHKVAPVERALLWRLTHPNRFSELSLALIRFQLGCLHQPPSQPSLQSALQLSSPSTPVILQLPPPSQTHPSQNPPNPPNPTFIHPLLAIQQLSKQTPRKDARIRLVTLGTLDSLSLAESAVRECRGCGQWLVLQDAHLIGQDWPRGLVDEIKTVLFGACPEELDCLPTPNSLSRASAPRPDKPSDHAHQDFRLWVVTRITDDDGNVCLPGCLLQRSVVMTTEMTSHLPNTVQRYGDVTSRAFDAWKRSHDQLNQNENLDSLVGPLSLLHSTLSHRRLSQPRPPSWSHHDYLTALHLVKQLFLHGNHDNVCDVITALYAGHCNHEEAVAMGTVVREMLLGEGFVELQEKLKEGEEMTTGTVTKLLAVNRTEETASMKRNSRSLLDKISRVTMTTDPSPSSFCDVIENVKSRWEDIMIEIPDTKPDDTNPVALVLNREVLEYGQLWTRIQKDILKLERILRGEISSTPSDDVIIDCLRHGVVPDKWTGLVGGKNLGLFAWFDHTEGKLDVITQYANHVSGGSDVIQYHVGALLRPERFVQAVLQRHARSKFRDLHTFTVSTQFLPVTSRPVAPPADGVYVSGLTLRNAFWDNYRNFLIPATKNNDSCEMPIVWLRPVSMETTDSTGSDVYRCPMVTPCGRSLMTLDLPTNQKPEKWLMDGVHLVASM